MYALSTGNAWRASVMMAFFAVGTLTFTLDEAGTYGYTCAMGMFTGTITAVEPSAADLEAFKWSFSEPS